IAQEALRLDLYRRIATAADHERLAEVREEAIDRYGKLPPEVMTLLDVASLRITCARLGVTEVSTYRDQVRVRPLELSPERELELAARAPGAAYHRTTSTLNLAPGRIAGPELPGWVERALLALAGSGVGSASIAG